MEEKQIQKHPGGRPTKYNPGIIQKVEEYFKTVGREQTSLPSVEGLAIYLDLTKDTIYRWAKIYPEISDALKRIQDRQKLQLMDDGMYGGKEVNAAMAIFLLKANHGLTESPTVLQQFNVGGKMDVIFTGDESSTVSVATEGSERQPPVQSDLCGEEVGKVSTGKINFVKVGS